MKILNFLSLSVRQRSFIMNFSYTILAMVVIVIYLKDSLSSRFNNFNFPIDGAKPILRESFNIGYSYLTFILVSCVVLSALVVLTNKIKKINASNRVQSVVNAHALLVVLALIVIIVIYPCVVGIKELLADSRNDVFTFWLFVFTVLGVSFGFPVFFAFISEWKNVTAKYESNNSEFVPAKLASKPVQDVTIVNPVPAQQVQQKTAYKDNGFKSKNFQHSRSKQISSKKAVVHKQAKSNVVNDKPQIEAQSFQPDLNSQPDYMDHQNQFNDFDPQYNFADEPNLDMPDYLTSQDQPPVHSDDDFDYEHNLAMRNQNYDDHPYAQNRK